MNFATGIFKGRIRRASKRGGLSRSLFLCLTIGLTALLGSRPGFAQALKSVSLSPTSVVGGTGSTGTVTLTANAPTGGASVSLTSGNTAAATVPSPVVVPAGQKTATFSATTFPVTANASAVITATYLSVSKTATLTVTPLLASMSFVLSSVPGGGPATGIVTLNGPAPTGGASIDLSSADTSRATVPSTVVAAAGTTVATFPIVTLTVGTSGSSSITASNAGTSKSANLTVTPSVRTYSLALSAVSAFGSSTVTGTVVLNGPAPAGGASVTLSSNTTSAATVPANVVISAGASSGTFTVTTLSVGTSVTVTITAGYGGNKTATLAVTATVEAESVALAPASVVRGNTSTATVRLNGPAPAGGATVTLASSSTSNATVPASVVVASAATTAAFTVTTLAAGTGASASISATYGVTRSSTLTITNALVAYTLALSPTGVVGGGTSTATVTLDGPASAGGVFVPLFSSDVSVATVPASVTVASGSTAASFTVTSLGVSTPSGVVIGAVFGGATASAALAVAPATLASLTFNPTTVLGGTPSTGTATLTGAAPTGGLFVLLSSSDTSIATVPGSVLIPAGASSTTFTATTLGVSTSKTAIVTGNCCGTVLTATLTVNPVALSSLTLNPTTVGGGSPSTGTVTLTGLAPSGGIVVSLSSSNTAAATVPANVTVPAGSATATFVATTLTVTGTQTTTITATYSGVSRPVVLTVVSVFLGSVAVFPSTIPGGGSAVGTVTLSGSAPAGGATVQLTSSNTSAATVAASVVVPAGTSSALFPVLTSPVAADAAVTISAIYATATQTAALTVKAPLLATFTPKTSTPTGGKIVPVTVTLNGPAPAGGTVVGLVSSAPAVAAVPSTVTVSPGALAATFSLTTSAVGVSTAVTLTATLSGVPLTVALTVAPFPQMASLALSASSIPGGNILTSLCSFTALAPAGGAFTTFASSDPSVANFTVSSTTFSEGRQPASCPNVTTSAVAVNSVVNLSATYGGVTKVVSLTVLGPATGPATLASVTASSVLGGSNTVVNVSLTAYATSDTVVNLSSSNSTLLSLPPTVTVAQNTATKSFAVTTGIPLVDTDVTITATLGSDVRTTTVMIWAPSTPHIVSATWDNGSFPLVGGAGTNSLFVKLTAPAPTGGLLVLLATSNAAAANPPLTMTVAAGATSGNLSVPTLNVTANTPVTLYLRGGADLAVTATVVPVIAGFNITSDVNVGSLAIPNVTVTLNVAAAAAGSITLASSDVSAVTLPASVNISSGSTSSAGFSVSFLSTTTLKEATLTATYLSATKARDTVDLPLDVGYLTVSPSTIVGGGTGSGTVGLNGTGHNTAVSMSNPNPWVVSIPSSVTVNLSNASAFTVTTVPVTQDTPVVLSASLNGVTKTATVTVSSKPGLSLVFLTTGGPGIVSGVVELTGGAPTAGAVVALTSSDPTAASVPPSVTIPSGATWQSFAITQFPVACSTTVTITATYLGTSKTAILAAAPAVAAAFVTIAPASVGGGTAAQGTVYLSAPAPAAGQSVTLSSDKTAATVPASITVPAGATSAVFAISTTSVASNTVATISATAGCVTRLATLTVGASGSGALSAVALSPSIVLRGATSTGTITLTGNAPAGGASVTLTSSDPAAIVTSPVVVPAGTPSVPFTITTSLVGSTKNATITATYNAVVKTAVLTVSTNPADIASIAASTRFTTVGSPYVLTSRVTVQSGATLTLDPGVTVRFASGTGLTVFGVLVAVGTSGSPIVFTSSAGVPAAGAWEGIHLSTAPANTRLQYVTIAFAGATTGAALAVDSGGPGTFDNLSVTDSSTIGILGAVAISNSSVLRCATGVSGAVALTSVTVSNCTGDGAVFVATVASSTISNNGGYGIKAVGGSSLNSTSITNNGNYAISTSGELLGLTGLTVSGNGGVAKNAILYTGAASGIVRLRAAGNLPWDILNALDVGAASQLTIDPGVTVRFGSGAYLVVNNGRLSAVGTSGQPIVFTSTQTTPAPGAWGCISFYPGGDASASRISYATIAYAGATSGFCSGATTIGGSPSIDHLTVTSSGTAGVSVAGGSPSISTATITGSGSDGVLVSGITAAPTLSGAAISGSGGSGLNLTSGAGVTMTSSTISTSTGYAVGAEANTRLLSLTGVTASANGGGTKNVIGYRGGTITGSEVWHTFGALSWDLISATIVGPSGSLALDPGVTVRSSGSTSLTVNGRLTASGTSTSPVLLTTSAPSPSPGSWRALAFGSGAAPSSSLLSYVTVAYAGQGSTSAVSVSGSSPSFDHLTVSNSSTDGFGVSGAGATPTLTGVVLDRNAGYGANASGGGALSINGGTITNNGSYAIGAESNTNLIALNGLTLSGNGLGSKNAIGHRGGILTGTDTWNAFAGLTWDVVGPVTVNPGGKLVINGGVTARFAPNTRLEIGGKLTINGAPANRVTLTSNQANPVPGSWGFVYLGTGGAVSGSVLAYTTVNFAGGLGGANWYKGAAKGAVWIDGSSPVLDHATISNASVAGVAVENTNVSPTIHNCTFAGNASGLNSVTASMLLGGVEARLNYWNAASGPSGSGTGSGQSVSTGVNFEPWLIAGGSSPEFMISFDTQNRLFNPAIESTTLSFSSSLPANWTFAISKSGGQVVRTFTGSGSTGTVIWDGKDGAGAVQLSGTYTYDLTSTSTVGDPGTQVRGLSILSSSLSLSNFTASANVLQINPVVSEKISYTSNAPFSLNETIVIKNAAGQTVRTLINNVARAGGSYVDQWDGKSDTAGFLGDGPYFFYPTVSSGANSFTLDLSNLFYNGYTSNSASSAVAFDPFNNRPLVLTYPQPQPARVSMSMGTYADFSCSPPNWCTYIDRYQESGTHTYTWAGVDANGVFDTLGSNISAGFSQKNWPKNAVVLYGTKPTLSNLKVTPPAYSPSKGSQTVEFDLSTFQNAPAPSITVTYFSQASLSVLRTLTLTNQTPGHVTLTWDGKAGNGGLVAPGYYTVTATVIDALGNIELLQILTNVDY